MQATEALEHKYFQESPIAKEPVMMPTFPSSTNKSKASRRDAAAVRASLCANSLNR